MGVVDYDFSLLVCTPFCLTCAERGQPLTQHTDGGKSDAFKLLYSFLPHIKYLLKEKCQGVAMHFLKFQPDLPCPTFLPPSGVACLDLRPSSTPLDPLAVNLS
jgi:hypothetical protein